MTSNHTNDRNARRHSHIAAKSHWIYTTQEVLGLYGVASNTLTAWKKLGLPSSRSGTDLYLGQDLNNFQNWYKRNKSRPLGLGEVFCVHCKQAHLIEADLYRIEPNEIDQACLIVQCPSTGKEAFKYVSQREIQHIEHSTDLNNRTQTDDYNVARLGSKTAFSAKATAETKNHSNIALRRDFQIYLKQAEGFREKTIIAALRHIAQFDAFTSPQSYSAITCDTIIAFKEHLEAKLSLSTSDQRSPSTVLHTLLDLKKFYDWLEAHAGIKTVASGLSKYFSPSRNLQALADAPGKDGFVPTPVQVLTIVLTMPHENFIQRRDRALLAFLLLSGARISAALSLQLRHIDLENRTVFQDARIVKTKNAKTMHTAWFPVGVEIEGIFTSWVKELHDSASTNSAPLFPRAIDPIRHKARPDEVLPLMDQGTVRKIIKRACTAVELPYFNPHALRKTLALMGDDVCKNTKQRKAWSQNLGHENIATTDQYYGKLEVADQFAELSAIRNALPNREANELFELVSQLTSEQISLITGMARQCVGKGASA